MQIEIYCGDRGLLLPLFDLADDSRRQISSYISRGEILVVRDRDRAIGHLQILEADAAGTFELKSMALQQNYRRQGIGRRLIESAVIRCRIRNGRRLLVSTATADTGNLRFYQRQGFRMYRIVQDAFGPERGYADAILVDGIPLRDQVLLELHLWSGAYCA